MALKIRLSRGGSKKRPFYRIVIADSRAPRDGRLLKKLAFITPFFPKIMKIVSALMRDRARHWLSVGARPTDRVARFMSERGLVEWKAGHNPQKGEPGEKAKQRAADKAEKQAAAQEAAQAASEETEESKTEQTAESSEAETSEAKESSET